MNLHHLGLDWCRMEPLVKGRSYTAGGWQAEQYLAFARCSLIMYSSIRDIVGSKEVGIDEHEFMSQSMLCFLCRVMQDKGIDREEHLHYIKCFLSACDLFEHVAYKMNGCNPIWFTKGNFLSLLNLPDQIAHFGSITNYWEGSRERSIQQIKPYLKHMRASSSFCKTKLNKMYVTQTLRNMYDDHVPTSMEQNASYDRYLSFKVYSDSTSLDSLVLDNNVISIIIIKSESNDEKYMICKRVKEGQRCKLYEVQFQDSDGFNKCGVWYAPICIKNQPSSHTYDRGTINEMACDYAILCPCISLISELKTCYTLFTKNWQYRIRPSECIHSMMSYDFVFSIINNYVRNINRTFVSH